MMDLLMTFDMEAPFLDRIAAAGFDIHLAQTAAERAALIPGLAGTLRAVLTNGSIGLSGDEIAALPKLEIICALGAGFERVDLNAARSRGIVVTHGPGANDAAVADHTMALLLTVVRNIPRLDAAVRRGAWRTSRALQPGIGGKRLGILGLGRIGLQVARRAAAFDVMVAYHNRSQRDDVALEHFPTAVALAEWADFLVVATPGGQGTAKLVDAAMLAALGPTGYLVNIARGSVVDTAALIDALAHSRIAGAALDVVEGEPAVPEALLALPNVVFTPHIAGRSPQAVSATLDLALANLRAHFAGEPVLTPVPA